MQAINHAVTGALVAVTIRRPELALSLAFVSHFVLDALPHYGGLYHATKQFLMLLSIDAALTAAFLGILLITQPEYWGLAIGGALLGASPDLMWLPYWLKELAGKRKQSDPLDPISQFHRRIQWGERPWGKYVELVWLAGISFVLLNVMNP